MAEDELLSIAARSGVAALRAVLEKAEGAPLRLIENHISWVSIDGALAYKLKKPVHLPFLDFRILAFLLLNSYLEARRDYDGLPALRFFRVSRALVRSHPGLPGRAGPGCCCTSASPRGRPPAETLRRALRRVRWTLKFHWWQQRL